MFGREVKEEEDGRNGTMKALSHCETEIASGDMAERRSRERPGRRKERWQLREQRRPMQSFSAACTLFDTIKGTFIFIF